MQSKRILVTGSNGQLGCEMRRLGAVSPNEYFFTDIAELDITDKAAVAAFVAEHGIEIIVNCAAYTDVDRAEEDEPTAERINSDAVRNLAEAMKAVDGTLFHISTDYVFGLDGNVPRTEDMPLDPLGAYGRTKLHGEQAIAASGCKHIIVRTAWLYSEHGHNFLKTMLRLTAERESLNVVFDQTGTPTYAGDLALALFSVIEGGTYEGNEGVYHFSNEGVCSWYDFAREIATATGRDCKIVPCHSSEFPSKVVRPPYSVLDKTKIKTTFGIEIPHWRDSMIYCLRRMFARG
ncbi:dTDP-4-dehydrorhamnose reductase [Alistipes sp. Z76]|jgi:dTDP-4-dehydrorhamnose reductase|nr:dTDP-4-dehydrorhamnose reductase [Alistipes sp. Z76]NCE67000.1 dTDP-4-dehydrorhamnose reductase [Muribaculaceae bacterium M3]